jgi:hypothetical protein
MPTTNINQSILMLTTNIDQSAAAAAAAASFNIMRYALLHIHYISIRNESRHSLDF